MKYQSEMFSRLISKELFLALINVLKYQPQVYINYQYQNDYCLNTGPNHIQSVSVRRHYTVFRHTIAD